MIVRDLSKEEAALFNLLLRAYMGIEELKAERTALAVWGFEWKNGGEK